jgi:hypothetical protein
MTVRAVTVPVRLLRQATGERNISPRTPGPRNLRVSAAIITIIM